MGKRSAEQRFFEKVDRGDCWLWLASTTPNGYGKMWFEGRLQPAHRVAYQLFVGQIPTGLHLDHLCRVPLCVNPAHLEPVTCRENTLRGLSPAAIAAHRGTCVNGHPYPEGVWRDRYGARKCAKCQREREKTPIYQAKHAARERRRRARIKAAERHCDDERHSRVELVLKVDADPE